MAEPSAVQNPNSAQPPTPAHPSLKSRFFTVDTFSTLSAKSGMFGPSVGCLFRTYQRTSPKTAAISRQESPALPLLRQQVLIQFVSRWRWVWLQLNACHTHVAAIQCRISDPLPQLLVMAQGATNLQPNVPCVCINKPWRDSTISTMTMNERHIVLTHFPCLLNDFF